MNTLHVVGARPNFMKAAPVLRELKRRFGRAQCLVHTGQHYDSNMSDVFFRQLEIQSPDENLNVGSGSHAKQTAEVMTRVEPVIRERKPDLVVVYGDVNSTLAATLVCAKLQIPIAHVEAGLRSFDRGMPEEINRIVTDRVADMLLTPSEDADANLIREGVDPAKIFRVGNVMIDTLMTLLPLAEALPKNGCPKRYALVTLHRPSNVDDPKVLRGIIQTLSDVSNQLDIIFPVHPRTRQRIDVSGLNTSNIHLLDPLPYIEFLSLQTRATVVITDSGGIQEETTFLRIPCLTLRSNTERPITISRGTNVLVGQNFVALSAEVTRVLEGRTKVGTIPPLWDGNAAQRIADVLEHALQDDRTLLGVRRLGSNV